MVKDSRTSLLDKRNSEAQKDVAAAALTVSSFRFMKLDNETATKLEKMKDYYLRQCIDKLNAMAEGVNTEQNASENEEDLIPLPPQIEEAMKNGNVVEFPELGKGIDGSILPELPPVDSLKGIIETCSKPFEKQLTKSDVDKCQNRLSLNPEDVTNALLPLLKPGEELSSGIPVITYDSEGKDYEMTFKTWNEKTHVLIGSWFEFVNAHSFQMATDWLTVWMFRHNETQKLCFVVTGRRLRTYKVLKRSRKGKEGGIPKKKKIEESKDRDIKQKKT